MIFFSIFLLVNATGDEIAREIAYEANVLHGGRSTTPIDFWDAILILKPVSPESVQPKDRSLQSSFGSIDSAFDLRSTYSDFTDSAIMTGNSGRSTPSVESLSDILPQISPQPEEQQAAVAQAHRKLLFEQAVAESHQREKLARREKYKRYQRAWRAHNSIPASVRISALCLGLNESQNLNRALTPAEVRFYNAFRDLEIALDGVVFTSVKQVTKDKLIRTAKHHQEVAKAYQEVLESRIQVNAERAEQSAAEEQAPASKRARLS